MNSTISYSQERIFGPKLFIENNQEHKVVVSIHYNDKYENGHNTFSITGAIVVKKQNGCWEDYSCGCIHDEIEKHFPELKKYIKWHLMSSDGPMHYVNNTLYLAGDRDCWGNRRGDEPILGEGKEREFDSARKVAVWPEATDEQLSLPPEELRILLLNRLPALVEEFKKDVEELGFVF